jgi:hypothetical protein
MARSTVHILRSGDLVRVKSLAAIKATLDANGALEALPFMPEMAQHAGKVFRVGRLADKTCVEGFGLRAMKDAVFLEELRCDGAAHDGCQRGCMIFWKTAWLEPAPGSEPARLEAAVSLELETRKGARYYCQSTELMAATHRLPVYGVPQLVSEVKRGELRVLHFFLMVGRAALNKVRSMLGLNDIGIIAGNDRCVARGELHLAPGEWVRIKSPDELRAALDSRGRNRGLLFEPDMRAYSGGNYQVSHRVDRIIHEETGRMVKLKGTVALKGVACRGFCSKNCPRNNYFYWRESWLARVAPGSLPGPATTSSPQSACANVPEHASS